MFFIKILPSARRLIVPPVSTHQLVTNFHNCISHFWKIPTTEVTMKHTTTKSELLKEVTEILSRDCARMSASLTEFFKNEPGEEQSFEDYCKRPNTSEQFGIVLPYTMYLLMLRQWFENCVQDLHEHKTKTQVVSFLLNLKDKRSQSKDDYFDWLHDFIVEKRMRDTREQNKFDSISHITLAKECWIAFVKATRTAPTRTVPTPPTTGVGTFRKIWGEACLYVFGILIGAFKSQKVKDSGKFLTGLMQWKHLRESYCINKEVFIPELQKNMKSMTKKDFVKWFCQMVITDRRKEMEDDAFEGYLAKIEMLHEEQERFQSHDNHKDHIRNLFPDERVRRCQEARSRYATYNVLENKGTHDEQLIEKMQPNLDALIM